MSKKERNAVWLYPETKELIEAHMKQDNCKSASEYIENAVKFYTGYLDSNSDYSTQYLSTVLTSVIDAIVKSSEYRISRNLFKLAVEVGAITHLQAAACELDEEKIAQLRVMCVEEVRKINGVIRHEDAVKFQRS